MQGKPNCARASPRHHIERGISPPAATWKSYRGVFRRLESSANPLAITPTGAMRVLERLLAAAVARPKRDATPRRIMFGLRDVSPVSSSGNDDFVCVRDPHYQSSSDGDAHLICRAREEKSLLRFVTKHDDHVSIIRD